MAFILHYPGGNVNPCSGRIVILRPEQLGNEIHDDPQFLWIKTESLLTISGLGRVSDPKQTAGYSLASQALEIETFACQRGMANHGSKSFVARVRHRRLTALAVAYLQVVIDREDVLLVTSIDRLSRRGLRELADRLHGTLYVCALSQGGRSEATLRSLNYKGTVHHIPH